MTNNKQQTAVQEFWDKIALKLSVEQVVEFLPLFRESKEMEKERIETAYNKGTVHGIDYPESTLPTTGEQYYEQKYGGGEQ
jgi:hypothetical protein